jgi:hypothetical protein
MIMTMKNKFILSLLTIVTVGACTYDFPEQAEPTSGTASFTKMIAIGSSFTAGFANGALYTGAQEASFPAIIAGQMKLIGGGDFNQPDINAVNGCYNPLNCAAAGRLVLKGLSSPKPTPTTPGNAITPYTGDKTKLNNFGVYGISIQLSLAAATSGPASPANPYYNPFFARFAATPSVNGTTGSSMIADASAALATNGTFFTFQLGADDVLAYALNGADQADPTRPLTSTPVFTGTYTVALNTVLGANATTKGVVINIPDITSLPHFSLVPYNAIPLDAGTAGVLTTQLANNYNAFLDGMAANMIITSAEATKRKLVYKTGQNAILINDETLTNLTPYMAGPYAGLLPYAIARQTTSADLIPLGTSGILGTAGTFGVLGVSEPLLDKYILLPSEITQIQASTDAFNAHIKSQADAGGDRLVLADLNKILKDLKTAPTSINGSSLSASISPPFGAYSTDGIHPNSRGYAYLANKFIETINGKWKSSIPECNPNDYVGNELPIP